MRFTAAIVRYSRHAGLKTCFSLLHGPKSWRMEKHELGGVEKRHCPRWHNQMQIRVLHKAVFPSSQLASFYFAFCVEFPMRDCYHSKRAAALLSLRCMSALSQRDTLPQKWSKWENANCLFSRHDSQ